MLSVYGPWPEDAPQVLLNLFCCCEMVEEDGGGGWSMILRLEDKFSERCASTIEALKSWSLGRSERSSAELMLLMSSSMGFWSMHFCESRSRSWEMAGGWACCGGGARPAPAPLYPLPTWPASSDQISDKIEQYSMTLLQLELVLLSNIFPQYYKHTKVRGWIPDILMKENKVKSDIPRAESGEYDWGTLCGM